jgi:hypothetical protein
MTKGGGEVSGAGMMLNGVNQEEKRERKRKRKKKENVPEK